MLEVQFFVAAFFQRFSARIAPSFKAGAYADDRRVYLCMTDGSTSV
jgi:hypothetical protein